MLNIVVYTWRTPKNRRTAQPKKKKQKKHPREHKKTSSSFSLSLWWKKGQWRPSSGCSNQVHCSSLFICVVGWFCCQQICHVLLRSQHQLVKGSPLRTTNVWIRRKWKTYYISFKIGWKDTTTGFEIILQRCAAAHYEAQENPFRGYWKGRNVYDLILCFALFTQTSWHVRNRFYENMKLSLNQRRNNRGTNCLLPVYEAFMDISSFTK